MEMRRIGGLTVSAVGLGCNNFGGRLDREASTAVIHAAIDAGITFFDTADIYGTRGASEAIIGQALAGGRRDRVVIGTKFAGPFDGEPAGKGAGAGWIREAVEGSLRRLQTDRIDLYQQHMFDPSVPIEETQGALAELVAAGKVREIGASNFSAAQIADAEALSEQRTWPRFASVQNRFSLLDRGALDEVIPTCDRLGVAFLPFFPLAAGMLTGKYRAGQDFPAGSRLAGMPAERVSSFANDRNHALVAALEDVATERGHTLLELAFAWLTAQPSIASVIAGATSPAQIAANVAAVDWTLGPDDLAAVDAALTAATHR
ncbi:MAG: aldo/keto reductase [Ilumatobacteraceae bacterium]